jgi:hypothetical protein
MGSSRFEFDTGEIACIKELTRIYSGRLLNDEVLVQFASEGQNCVILHVDKDFGSIFRDRYFIFLQVDQIQGWVNYYDLEKLDG